MRHKAIKPTGIGRYSSGQKRCQICEIFLNWSGLWCPCCGYRLRTRPRNVKFKAELRAFMELNGIELPAPKQQSNHQKSQMQGRI
jgi:hypothetical protein